MKRTLLVLSSLILGVPVFAEPQAVFLNRDTITNAIPIDATVVINRGTFTNILTTEFPYEMSNMRYFTNEGSGVMHGSTGFRFETVLDTFGPSPRQPLASFHNADGGIISATDSGSRFFGFANGTFLGTSAGTASYVEINATNVVNEGSLSVGNVGLMQIKGKNVNLTRGSLSAGTAGNSDTNFFFNDFFSGSVSRGFFLFGNAYVNAFGVEDLYWGAGPTAENLPNLVGRFNPPFVSTPSHLVQFRPGPLGTTAFGTLSLPLTFPADFVGFADVHQFGTNKTINIVFVKTNFADTNISFDVRFGFSSTAPNPPFSEFGRSAFVEFSVPEFDPISGEIITNAVYLIDSSAEQQSLVLLTNALSANSVARPSSYEITTAMPFEFRFAQPANTPYDPALIYPGVSGTYKENETEDGFYGAYGAQIGRNPERASGITANTNLLGFGNFFGEEFLLFPDPTNQPGRIEIEADVLDLTLARIRAEGILDLNVKHLKSGGAFDVSAGMINADLGSTNGSLVISNVFPSHFKRVRGDLYAWSAIWNNTETNDFETNAVSFHILVVDHDLKADFKPTIRGMTLRSTNIIVKDDLTINRTARFYAENLTFGGAMPDGGTNVVTLIEDAVDFGADNLIGIKNFLNESNSVFQGADELTIGYDDPQPYVSIINRGTISATAPYFKATTFRNNGAIFAENGGSMEILAGTADLSGGTNLADRSIYISAGTLSVTNSILTAGMPGLLGNLEFGKLFLNITNLITDFAEFGDPINNFWQVSDGFTLQRKPVRGDLLGTEIRTVASGFNEVQHIWAGQDVGPGPDGYIHNVAIGHLILDVQSVNAKLRFSAAGFQNALYVVNLDFNLGPDIDINTSLNNLMEIDENMRIYYINSNAGDKLTNAFPDQVVQVENFGLAGGLTPMVVVVNGLGVIAPNLNGKNLVVGREYTMRAIPGAGQIFTGWSGATNSSAASLKFTMRPGLVLQANNGPNPLDAVKGSYNGLFYEAGGVNHESSGFINFKVTKKGVVTGKINSGKTYRFKGNFNPASGLAEIPVSRGKGKTPLNLRLQLDLDFGSDQVNGTVSADGWEAVLRGDLAKAGPQPVPNKTRFTMVIAGNTNPAAEPGGAGFATIQADAAGSLHFKGELADGTKFNQRAPISKNGEVPFYLSLYKGTGSVLSWIYFTNDVFSSLQGDLSWIKKASSKGVYQNGFTNETTVLGSSYVPPAANSRVIDVVEGTVTLSGGNLDTEAVSTFALSENNIVTVLTGDTDLSLSISLPTGQLKGNFAHPDSDKKTAIKGVILQQRQEAHGYFLGTSEGGAFDLSN